MRTEGVAVTTASQSGGLWSMPVMPSPARKQKIVRVFFQKRAIELQTAVAIVHTGQQDSERFMYDAGRGLTMDPPLGYPIPPE